VEFPPVRGHVVVELVHELTGLQLIAPSASVKVAFSEEESSPIPLLVSICATSPTVMAQATEAQSIPLTAAVRVVTLTVSLRVW
jgi:hypothetical protein